MKSKIKKRKSLLYNPAALKPQANFPLMEIHVLYRADENGSPLNDINKYDRGGHETDLQPTYLALN